MTCEHNWFNCGPFKVCLKCSETTKWDVIVPDLRKAVVTDGISKENQA